MSELELHQIGLMLIDDWWIKGVCMDDNELFAIYSDDHLRFESILSELRRFGSSVAKDQKFPPYFFSVEKKTPKSGVNYSVVLSEIPYPFSYENGKDRMVSSSIMRIEEMGEKSKSHDRIYVYLNAGTYALLPPPPGSVVRPVLKKEGAGGGAGASGYDIYLNLYDEATLTYLKAVIQFLISRYSPSMPAFGCCDRYVKCSDLKQCVHDNPFYFRSCRYRNNLKSGKVFYGKNKNI